MEPSDELPDERERDSRMLCDGGPLIACLHAIHRLTIEGPVKEKVSQVLALLGGDQTCFEGVSLDGNQVQELYRRQSDNNSPLAVATFLLQLALLQKSQQKSGKKEDVQPNSDVRDFVQGQL